MIIAFAKSSKSIRGRKQFLKRAIAASSMCIGCCGIALALLAIFWVVPGHAAPSYLMEPSANGPILSFTQTEMAFGAGKTAPTSGWQARSLPALGLLNEAESKTGRPPAVWFRFRFDRNTKPDVPLALEVDHTSERFVVNLNGVDIFRNFSDDNVVMFGWNRPWMTTLPPQLLRQTGNLVAVRVDTNVYWNLGIGGMRIGPDREIRADHDWRYLMRHSLPQMINWMILLQAVGIGISWFAGRKDPVIIWASLTSALWWFGSLHYYVSAPPFDSRIFWELTLASMMALVISLYGFATSFLEVPNQKRVLWGLSVIGLGLIVGRALWLDSQMTGVIVYAFSVPVSWLGVYVLARACWQEPGLGRIAMLVTAIVSIGFNFHDFGLAIGRWQGVAFYLQPYGSIMLLSVWGFAQWAKMAASMNEVEVLNATLEQRVNVAQLLLAESEAARRTLEVQTAVDRERERLMMEIHDGIGSNLITALSAAENKHASPDTIHILRQSITDLKITVDSLEPIEGHVTSLLANLRQRLEPDLSKAGFSFDWRVQDAPALIWLDAIAALHVLRIVQAAIGNIVAHSGSNQIIVECGESTQGGADGVSITIGDTGRGFDFTASTQGKGIANMESRAKSLHGTLRCTSSIGKGTTVRLWLPILAIRVQASP